MTTGGWTPDAPPRAARPASAQRSSGELSSMRGWIQGDPNGHTAYASLDAKAEGNGGGGRSANANHTTPLGGSVPTDGGEQWL